MNNNEPLNVCVLKYEQDGKIFTATSSSIESKYHAVEQGLEAFERIQVEKKLRLNF